MSNRKVYITFLGTNAYQSTRYKWITGEDTFESPYGQEAELILAKKHTKYVPDVVYVFGTEIAIKANWTEWCGWCYRENTLLESKGLGIEPRLQKCLPETTTIELVTIQDGLESLSQWKIFESLVAKIEEKDELVIDITHGYRVTPVILSSALHFLRLTKQVTIKHVFYAAFETREQRIIDYVGFYDIQDLTEGVARLNDEADMRYLLTLSQKGKFPIDLSPLRKGDLFHDLKRLTDSVRNVESHVVGKHAQKAMDTLARQLQKSIHDKKIIPTLLLQKIKEKFTKLSYTTQNMMFDEEYFRVQQELISTLIKHQLFMQAYTVLREYIGSIGMIFIDGSTWKNNQGRNNRFLYGETFLGMIQFAHEFTITGQNQRAYNILQPHYNQLLDSGIATQLQTILVLERKTADHPHSGINSYRTAFAHACTKQLGVPEGWENAAEYWLKQLKIITADIFALQTPS